VTPTMPINGHGRGHKTYVLHFGAPVISLESVKLGTFNFKFCELQTYLWNDPSRSLTYCLLQTFSNVIFTERRYASVVHAVVVCPSVRLSHAGIVPTWLNVRSQK